jgi:hypothetical protein
MSAMKAQKKVAVKQTRARAQGAAKELRHSVETPRAGNEQAARIAEAWREEIAALKSQRFESVSQALEMVTNQVVSRLGGDEEMKEFILLMGETDPLLLRELGALVKLG